MFKKQTPRKPPIVRLAAVITSASVPFAALTIGAICLTSSRHVKSAVTAFRLDQVIVKVKPGLAVGPVNIRNNTTTIRQIAGTDFYLLQVATSVDASDAVNSLKTDDSVADASLNRVVQSPFTSLSQSIMTFPDGYAVPGQTAAAYTAQRQALEGQLNLAATHFRSKGAGTTVAVIDTGIDRTHPVLANHLWIDDRDHGDLPGNQIDDDMDGLVDDAYGWDLVSGDNDPNEGPDSPATTVAGHGTFIAGLITMVAPDCRIMPVRAFSPQGESDEFTVAEAIKWATDHGADVINMSFGTPDYSAIL
ncbi:MAG TPA: S8 family serine peptidase, partial [Blastocatellia bacterium]|nr:S8 family serine peptidase [Blastocatellia bacterium]